MNLVNEGVLPPDELDDRDERHGSSPQRRSGKEKAMEANNMAAFETQVPEEPSKAEMVFREDIDLKVTLEMKRCIAESLNKLDVAYDYFDNDCDVCDGFIYSAAAIDCWLDKQEGAGK